MILSDTSEKYEPGDRVTIAANVLFKDYNPQFQDGMRIVTPIRADQNNTSRTYFGTEGTYYVTPDATQSPPLKKMPQAMLPRQVVYA